MTVATETDFASILRVLASAQVDVIVIGAIAAISHGVIVTTEYVDVVYSRSTDPAPPGYCASAVRPIPARSATRLAVPFR
ncbi:hypothetical protein BH18VER1_BH18VER1_01330 [soil metagenome]